MIGERWAKSSVPEGSRFGVGNRWPGELTIASYKMEIDHNRRLPRIIYRFQYSQGPFPGAAGQQRADL